MNKITGTVKWFDCAKGFGFITNESGTDIFVHYRQIEVEGFKRLSEGQRVEFLAVEGEKGLLAEAVTPMARPAG